LDAAVFWPPCCSVDISSPNLLLMDTAFQSL